MAENESMWRNLTSLVDRKGLSSAQWRLAVLGLMLGSVGAGTGPVSALTPDGEEKTETLADKPGPLEMTALSYMRFRADVTAIEGMTFETAQVTRDAHKRLASHASRDLVAGWMAYAALIAADTPEFADAVKAEVLGISGDKKKKRKKRRRRKKDAADLEGRHAFIAKISADPRYPRSMPGADAAIAAILSMTDRDHARMTALGESFKTQAYAMQKTRWGKRKISMSATQRISEAEYYTQSRPGIAMPQLVTSSIDGVSTPGIMTTTDYTWKPDWGYQTTRDNELRAGSDATIDRILNLAARYAVGALNDKVVRTYASSRKSEQCLSLVKLTLNQCIAATRTPYEEAFCLGEHGLNDVAGCVGWVAGHGG
ncbi:MAG: hypothetical protein AAGH42_02920 [Pseudomonadota bacterium]